MSARGGWTGLVIGVMLGSSFGLLLLDNTALGMSLGVAPSARRGSGDAGGGPTKDVDG